MANLFTLGFGKVSDLMGKLAEAGLTAEMAEEVRKNPALAEIIVNALKQQPAPTTLVHGVFTKQDDVLAAFKARCAAKDVDFGKFSWVGSGQAPEFDPNDPETVVVLDATLDTLQNTFEFAWAWTVDGQDDEWRWNGMTSGAEKLALLDGLEFKPYTLRWVRIKLDTNVCKKPIDVRNAKSSPGCALLFMSAEHPARIKATDYKRRFGFWLPGLKCTAPDGGPWRYVPGVYFDRAYRQVKLLSFPYDNSDAYLAVPSFRE